MKDYTLKNIANILNGKLDEKFDHLIISDVCTDTRKIKKGDLFFALSGESFDGHDYVDMAFKNGASAAVVSKNLNYKYPVILVEDVLLSYGKLAKDYRSLFNTEVIAVTGSVGKTSTKEFVAFLVSEAGKTLKNEANFNNEIGLPTTLFGLDNTYKYCVCEMGMRGKGQITYLADIAKPKIGIISNISMSHIELLGSLDNIADAKSELLDSLPSDGYAILNNDSEYIDFMKARAKCKVITFGESETSDVRLKNLSINKDGYILYDVETLWGNIDNIKLPTIAYHNAINSLPAIICAKIFGVSNDDIKNKIASFKSVEKRFNIIKSKSDFIVIDDTYNAGPLSVCSAIRTVRLFDRKDRKHLRRIAILGDMFELGKETVASHELVGATAKENNIDLLVCVGNFSKSIAEGAIRAGFNKDNIIYFDNSTAALEGVKNMMTENDVVLIKGSHSMHMDIIANGLVEL